MSVYTRTGDKGKTALYAGKRVSKASTRVDAYGSVDELNSSIGIAVSEVRGQSLEVRKELIKIQDDLFEIGAALANPHSTGSGQASSKIKLTKRVTDFENTINKLEKDLPPLANFILPGGGRAGSLLHFARTIARRAERRIVELSEQENPSASRSTVSSDRIGSGQGVQNEIIVYINRLSDLLFMFARFINHKEKRKEILWKSR